MSIQNAGMPNPSISASSVVTSTVLGQLPFGAESSARLHALRPVARERGEGEPGRRPSQLGCGTLGTDSRGNELEAGDVFEGPQKLRLAVALWLHRDCAGTEAEQEIGPVADMRAHVEAEVAVVHELRVEAG